MAISSVLQAFAGINSKKFLVTSLSFISFRNSVECFFSVIMLHGIMEVTECICIAKAITQLLRCLVKTR